MIESPLVCKELDVVAKIEALQQELEEVKLKNRSLIEDQKTLESYLEASRLIVGVVELRDGRLYSSMANDAARKILGLPGDRERHSIDLKRVNISDAVVQMWIRRYSECYRQRQPLTWEDDEVVDGMRKISSTTTHFAGLSQEGNPRFCYIAQDITERAEMVRCLSEYQIKLNTALDFGKLGIWEWNTETDRLFWSDTMRGVFGLPVLNDISRIELESILEFIHPDDRNFFIESFKENRITGNEYLIEFRTSEKKAQTRWVQWRGKPVFDLNGKCSHFIGTAQDISEFKYEKIRKQEEASRLSHLSKLSALGEMASAVAHEINNPISIIRGYADLLLKKTKPGSSTAHVAEYAEEIRVVCNRISQIVNGLSLAARDGSGDAMEVEDMTGIVLNSLPFCTRRLEKFGIELRKQLSSNPIQIQCRSSQISQVFVNLLSNAIDSVKHSPTPWIGVQTYQKDGFAFMEVTDSGKGILPGVVEKIFQPFFTTKPVGEGLGIGLTISKGIVESHGGTIEWTGNAPGACFKIKLPLAKC